MPENKDLLKPLREHVYAKMRQRNWTLLHMSVACGVSVPTLNSILAKKNSNVSLSTILKISEEINIPVAKLIGCNEIKK